jgi:hypothetical protein
VKINLEFNELKNCYWSGTVDNAGVATTDMAAVVPGELSASLFVDYIYLDTDERRRFAQVSHEYLCSTEVKSSKELLVNCIIYMLFATLSNCGEILRYLSKLLVQIQFNLICINLDNPQPYWWKTNEVQRLNVSGSYLRLKI